jgi:hypothetical protein
MRKTGNIIHHNQIRLNLPQHNQKSFFNAYDKTVESHCNKIFLHKENV